MPIAAADPKPATVTVVKAAMAIWVGVKRALRATTVGGVGFKAMLPRSYTRTNSGFARSGMELYLLYCSPHHTLSLMLSLMLSRQLRALGRLSSSRTSTKATLTAVSIELTRTSKLLFWCTNLKSILETFPGENAR
jgi:hypothetical protein